MKRTTAVHVFGWLTLMPALACADSISVSNGADFQAALNRARPGDTIVLEAGATYFSQTGFRLPYIPPVTNTDADTITITTSNLAGISPAGARINPAVHAAAMPKLVSGGGNNVIEADPRAHHWRFVGIEFTTDGQHDAASLVSLGPYVPLADRYQMTGIKFDRCFLHPAEISGTNLSTPVETSLSKALMANVSAFELTNSYVVGGSAVEKFSKATGSGMAFLSDTGPGPLLVQNNYLEAFYSPLFLGGADGDAVPEHTATIAPGATMNTAVLSTVKDLDVGDYVAFQIRPFNSGIQYGSWGVGRVTGLSGLTVSFEPLSNPNYQGFPLPPMAGGQAQWEGAVLHDVTVRQNTIVAARNGLKYLWPSQGRFPKSWFEIKAGVNLTIEGNLFRSDIPTNVAFYPQNQNGGFPWVEVSNVAFINNRLINAEGCFGVTLLSNYGVQQDRSKNYLIHNNLCEGALPQDIPGQTDGSRMVRAVHHGQNIRITHNTVLNTGQVGYVGPPAVPGLVITDNIVRNGEYGWNCESPSGGGGTGGSACYSSATLTRNVIIDNRSAAAKAYSLPYPSGNWYPSTDTQVGWVDLSSGNYRLSPSSPYRGQGTNHADPGVDMDQLEAAMGGLAFSQPRPPQNVRATP